jgi:hypothetical protein
VEAPDSSQPVLEDDHDENAEPNQDDEQDRGRQVHGVLTIAAIGADLVYTPWSGAGDRDNRPMSGSRCGPVPGLAPVRFTRP